MYSQNRAGLSLDISMFTFFFFFFFQGPDATESCWLQHSQYMSLYMNMVKWKSNTLEMKGMYNVFRNGTKVSFFGSLLSISAFLLCIFGLCCVVNKSKQSKSHSFLNLLILCGRLVRMMGPDKLLIGPLGCVFVFLRCKKPYILMSSRIKLFHTKHVVKILNQYIVLSEWAVRVIFTSFWSKYSRLRHTIFKSLVKK